MDVSNIIAEFGAYYVKGSQNESRLHQLIRFGSVTASLFTQIVTDDTIWQAASSTIGRILQPFQKQWSPTGSVTFKAEPIKNFKMKGDVEEYPDDLEATWLGFLSGEGLDRKEWPFIRWMIEKHFLPQILEDLEMNEIFSGVYAAPGVPGTAGAAGTAMDGIKEIRNTHITSGRITPIAIGALSTDPATFVDQIETFCDGISKRYFNVPMDIAMGQHLERRYVRGYKAKYGTTMSYAEGQRKMVDGTNLAVVGAPSHNASSIIWATPKANAVRLVKKSANMTKVNVENVDRLVKVYTDFWNGVGFIIPEAVFTNDSELPV